jgi:hypothetical protein
VLEWTATISQHFSSTESPYAENNIMVSNITQPSDWRHWKGDGMTNVVWMEKGNNN